MKPIRKSKLPNKMKKNNNSMKIMKKSLKSNK